MFTIAYDEVMLLVSYQLLGDVLNSYTYTIGQILCYSIGMFEICGGLACERQYKDAMREELILCCVNRE